MKSVEPDSDHVQQKLKTAAGQTGRRNLLLGRLHADILTSDWTYVRAVALPMLPSLEQWEKTKNTHLDSCHSCRQFVLDQDQLKGLVGWLDRLMGPVVLPQFPVDEQYGTLLTRIIGFLLVSDCEPPFSRLPLVQRLEKSRELNEEAVVGLRKDGVGVTSETPGKDDVNIFTPDDAHINSKRPGHLGSLRTVVLWSREQLSVLLSGQKKIILDADFVCGKTLLLKSFAMHLANNLQWQTSQETSRPEERVDIIFLSVSAARTQVCN